MAQFVEKSQPNLVLKKLPLVQAIVFYRQQIKDDRPVRLAQLIRHKMPIMPQNIWVIFALWLK